MSVSVAAAGIEMLFVFVQYSLVLAKAGGKVPDVYVKPEDNVPETRGSITSGYELAGLDSKLPGTSISRTFVPWPQ